MSKINKKINKTGGFYDVYILLKCKKKKKENYNKIQPITSPSLGINGYLPRVTPSLLPSAEQLCEDSEDRYSVSLHSSHMD